MVSLAPFIPLRALLLDEERTVLEHFFTRPASRKAAEEVEKLLSLAHILRGRDDDEARALASNLSTRQLVRVSSRLVMEDDDDFSMGFLVENACLFRFLPPLAREILHSTMLHVGMALVERKPPSAELKILVQNLPRPVKLSSGRVQLGWLVIGPHVRAPIYEPRSEEEKSLIPDTLFFENPRQVFFLKNSLV